MTNDEFYWKILCTSAHIVGTYEKRIFDDREVKFNIGEIPEDEVISGIQNALTHFGKGETSKYMKINYCSIRSHIWMYNVYSCSRLVISPAYAFGEKGNEAFQIPPNATVEYKVTLIDFERVSCNL